MKSATKFKCIAFRRIAAKEVLSLKARVNADEHLFPRAKHMLHFLLHLAAEDQALLPYTVEEIAAKLLRPIERTQAAAADAAAAGYIKLDADVMILTPRKNAP